MLKVRRICSKAVGMLATATSFHASNDREVVNWFAPEHIAHLTGTVKRHDDDVQIDMTIFDPTPPTITYGNVPAPSSPAFELPANAPRKRFKINGAPKRTIDLIGQMKVVQFAPTDLHLVDGPPEERRRFLDRALCQLNPRYCQALTKYRKVVTQRSALLKRIRDNQEGPDMLHYVDEQLTALASQVVYERVQMIDALNQPANEFQQTISGGREQLHIVYRPSFKVDAQWTTQEASQHYQTQLHEARKRELQLGVCLLGPHRDDLEFMVNGVNMLTYGSRGQQRTAALATKLAELAFMRNSIGDEPVLLLDDVFSELDHARREYLLQQVAQHEQVMLTGADLTGFPATIMQQAHIYQVVDGTLAMHR